MVKWKCYYCGKEVQENEKCNCKKSKEMWRYITTNTVKTDEKYVCLCGYDKFKTVFHMDLSDSYSTTYECDKCGNRIGIHSQRMESWW